MNLSGEWIYYMNGNDGYSIYAIKLDGTGQRKVNDEYSFYFAIVGDWIIYSLRGDGDASYDERGERYIINIDGSGRRLLN
jgi:hypothetical protein